MLCCLSFWPVIFSIAIYDFFPSTFHFPQVLKLLQQLSLEIKGNLFSLEMFQHLSPQLNLLFSLLPPQSLYIHTQVKHGTLFVTQQFNSIWIIFLNILHIKKYFQILDIHHINNYCFCKISKGTGSLLDFLPPCWCLGCPGSTLGNNVKEIAQPKSLKILRKDYHIFKLFGVANSYGY